MDTEDTFLPLSTVTCLLITFANSLDADQDQQNVFPDMDPKLLDTLDSIP